MTCEIDQCTRCGSCNKLLDNEAFRAEEEIIEAEEAGRRAQLEELMTEKPGQDLHQGQT